MTDTREMDRRLLALVAIIAVASIATTNVVAADPVVRESSIAAPEADIPGTSCAVFPTDNVWNMDISKLPVHRRSDVWKKAMHAGTTNLHPDFGPPDYGLPFDTVEADAPTVSIDFTYASESDAGPYPFSGATPIEGGSDRHALTVSESCVLYELFNARWNGGDPSAGSGAIFDLQSNDLRPRGWTSADAAGLPILPGLVRWDEVDAGYIGHAIRVTSDCTSRRFLWPARHQAGVRDDRCPPMGARFRLRRSFDVSGFSDDANVVLKALKHFGLIVADNGSDWYFQGTRDAHWTNDLLDQLKQIPAGAFVAVDEAGCKVSSGSGQYEYGPDCPSPNPT